MKRSFFTLLELVIVIAIILIISTSLWVTFNEGPKEAYITKAKTEMQNILAGFTAFKMQYGVHAEGFQNLEKVLGKDVDAVDPWGTEYKIEFDDRFEKWRLTSAGPDKAFDTDEDIFSWK